MTDRRMMPWSQPGEVEEDGDQGFTPFPTHCRRFECNFQVDYIGGRPTTKLDPPLLVRDRNGFWRCPKCRNSYGRKWWEDESPETP